jgi:hypothetical protein
LFGLRIAAAMQRCSHLLITHSLLFFRPAFSKVTLTMFPLALGFEEIFAPYLSTEGMVNILSGFIKLVLTVMALLMSLYVPSFSYLWYVRFSHHFPTAPPKSLLSLYQLTIRVAPCFRPPGSALVGIVCTMAVSVIFPALAHLQLFGAGLPLYEVLTDYLLVATGLSIAIYGAIVHST